MNKVEYVPTIIPNNIAKVKLRIVSPPNKKIHKRTIAVLMVVLKVLERVLFIASFITAFLSRDG